jgi:hypothetical protein
MCIYIVPLRHSFKELQVPGEIGEYFHFTQRGSQWIGWNHGFSHEIWRFCKFSLKAIHWFMKPLILRKILISWVHLDFEHEKSWSSLGQIESPKSRIPIHYASSLDSHSESNHNWRNMKQQPTLWPWLFWLFPQHGYQARGQIKTYVVKSNII